MILVKRRESSQSAGRFSTMLPQFSGISVFYVHRSATGIHSKVETGNAQVSRIIT